MKKLSHLCRLCFLAVLLVTSHVAVFGQNPQPEVTVIQPSEAGISWLTSSTYLISWTDNFVNPVDIYLLDYSVVVPIIHPDPDEYLIAEDVEGSTYGWDIAAFMTALAPDAPDPGDEFTIRVQSSVDPDYNDEGDNAFALVTTLGGGINVIQPNGGEQWLLGATYLISWTDNLAENVDIELTDLNGDWVADIASDVPGSTYSWEITDLDFNPGTYKVRVFNTGVGATAISDATFGIVSSFGSEVTIIQPNGGEIWKKGTAHLISWIDDFTDDVDIELWWDDPLDVTVGPDTPYGTIASDVAGSTYVWDMATNFAGGLAVVPVGDYYIRIIESNGSIDVFSETTFEIVEYLPGGGIEMIQPNGGEIWKRGTSQLISWLDDLDEPVKIELLDENGDAIVGLPDLVSSTTGSTWTWSIPSNNLLIPEGDYIIKITSTFDINITAQSAAVFTLVDYLDGDVTVIQPNGGEVWELGTAHLISWVDNLEEPVEIWLTNGVDSWELECCAAGSTWTWDIPDGTGLGDPPAGLNYKIAVISTQNGTINDISDANFELRILIDAAVYPNPCDPMLTVEFDNSSTADYTINLYDRFGTSVLQKTVNTSNTKQVTFQTANLPEGIYFLNMSAGQKQISKKVLVQH